MLARLQEQDRETAEVIRQLALQNQEMATSIQALAARIRALGYGLVAAILIGAIAFGAALLSG